MISFNTCRLTLECLSSVRAQMSGDITSGVIVVDNASTDGSADAIAGRFPQVELVRLDRNVGFAKANNLAAGRAHGEYLLLLNPDTVVQDRAIERLVAFADAHPQTAIFGGRTVFGDGTLNPASCWRRPTLWSVFCIASGLTSVFGRWGWFSAESYGRWKRDTVREVDIVSGCFFLIRRSVWDELGGFDPAFFMYGEEADLCLRAKKLGHKCLICPDAQIVHYGGASERVRADKMVRLFVAKSLLFQRHWGRLAAWMGVRLLDVWALSRYLVFGLLRTAMPSLASSASSWQAIWRRRDEWHTCSTAPSTSAIEVTSLTRGTP